MPAQVPAKLLSLESSLLEDADGERLRALLDEFQNVAMQARQQAYQGVPPQEYEALQQLEKSAETAVDVVQKVWNHFHHAQ